MNTEIIQIEIDKIIPNPYNPRSDLRNLTELADSIKEKGILQNLTVSPDETTPGQYIAVIGHRRLAAAQAAGLKTVPCIIRPMSTKEQIATMVLENMQRNNLTVIEEAQGMQLMIDMGDSVPEVAKQTGLSQKTVKSRVQIMSLGKENLEAVKDRQISIGEFEKLFEIDDNAKRIKLLDDIGTSNFNFKLMSAKKEQENDKKKESYIQEVRAFAEEIDTDLANSLKYIKYIPFDSELLLPKISSDLKYYYTTDSNGIRIYTEYYNTSSENNSNDTVSESPVMLNKSEKEDELLTEFGRISATAYDTRFDFMQSLQNLEYKEQLSELVNKFINRAFTYQADVNEPLLRALLKEPVNTSSEEYMPKYKSGKLLASALYISLHDDIDVNCLDEDNEYQKNDDLFEIYSLLELLGYEPSDEEKQMLDGTHPLYKQLQELYQEEL